MGRSRSALVLAALAAAAFAAGLATATLPGDGGGDRALRVDRFDEERAFAVLREQVRLGPRPAGSAASRRLAERLRRLLPDGRLQPVPGGLQNVYGVVSGRDPSRVVLVGAHYDTKDLPGVVGANDGASGVAVAVELARSLEPGQLRPTILIVLFDGEETPAGSTGSFLEDGVRGSRVAARTFAPEAMVLLDMVGDRDLSIPREANSDAELWRRLRAAASRVGAAWAFPPETRSGILDDHIPFLERGVPAVDVIDFTFPCWHRPCDDLDTVSPRSLDAVGETVLELLRRL